MELGTKRFYSLDEAIKFLNESPTQQIPNQQLRDNESTSSDSAMSKDDQMAEYIVNSEFERVPDHMNGICCGDAQILIEGINNIMNPNVNSLSHDDVIPPPPPPPPPIPVIRATWGMHSDICFD